MVPPSQATSSRRTIRDIKVAEATKAATAKVKMGAFWSRVGNMLTAEASETEATARKTTNRAVNLLNKA